jgi:hypothetical protein
MSKYKLLINKITKERAILINGTEKIFEKENPIEYKKLRKLAINNARKSAYNDAIKSCSLIKVKGALGGTYWE